MMYPLNAHLYSASFLQNLLLYLVIDAYINVSSSTSVSATDEPKKTH